MSDPMPADSPDLDLPAFQLHAPSRVVITQPDGTAAVTFHGDGRVVVGELDDDRLREAIEAASEKLTRQHERHEAELREARADGGREALREWADWIERGTQAAGLPEPFTLRTVMDWMRSGHQPFGAYAADSTDGAGR